MFLYCLLQFIFFPLFNFGHKKLKIFFINIDMKNWNFSKKRNKKKDGERRGEDDLMERKKEKAR